MVDYDFFTVPLINDYYKIGQTEKANAAAVKLSKSMTSQLAYFFSFPDADLKPMDMNIQEAVYTIQRLSVALKDAKQEKLAAETEATLKKYYDLYVEKVYQPANQ